MSYYMWLIKCSGLLRYAGCFRVFLCDCCTLVDCYGTAVLLLIRFVMVVAMALILVKLFWMVARVLLCGWKMLVVQSGWL